MLCIPQQTVEAAHTDICGSLFEKVMIFSISLFIMSSALVSNSSFSLIKFLFMGFIKQLDLFLSVI